MSTSEQVTQARALFLGVLIVSAPRSASGQVPELLLFGREDHKTFLGCLNCSRFASESICNRFGDHGSRFSDKSIWNRFGDYGSRFSSYSPWSRFASDPPVLVDADGKFYGYFTANRSHTQRTTIKALVPFLDEVDWINEDLQRARDAFCEQ